MDGLHNIFDVVHYIIMLSAESNSIISHLAQVCPWFLLGGGEGWHCLFSICPHLVSPKCFTFGGDAVGRGGCGLGCGWGGLQAMDDFFVFEVGFFQY